MKHNVCLFVILAVSFAVAFPQPGLAFTDVSAGTQYRESISEMKDRGVIEGYADGKFRPLNTINRAEFLKIVLEGRQNDADYSGGNCFPDVRSEWFAPYVCTAKSEGIIGGYPDGTFKPEQNINFAEAGKIFALSFGQDIADEGGEWYAKYARALEASNAIAPSIDSMDKKITRGEMVEMMWRLADNRTDQPSISYLNAKYPQMEVQLSADTVERAVSCADIQAFAEEASLQGSAGGIVFGKMMPPESMQEADTANETAVPVRQKADYSDTNVQVAGVDEADIVKTDGTYLYAIRGDKIYIVLANPGRSLEIKSKIDLDDSTFTPQELYIENGKLVAIGSVWQERGPVIQDNMMKMISPEYYPYPYPYGVNRTQVRLYDVSDAENPKQIRKVTFDGQEISSRRIGNKMYLVLNQNINWWGGPVPLLKSANEETLVPKFEDSARGDKEMPVSRCSDIVILPRVPSPQYLIVAVIPVDLADGDISHETIIGNGSNVYMSLENLYVANPQWDYVWRAGGSSSSQKTNVFKFDIGGSKALFEAQGSVPGTILNQFSMDENGDYFRIATTTGQVWNADELSGNNLYILDKDMDTVGKVENIAPGESIKSVRFMGKRAYMVTFKQIDPLFVIDVSDPKNPEILGKLKIPGYSDYLHPYDETHLIGFGKEVDETIDADKVHSDNAVYYTAVLGMKLAIFDVSDVANPRETFKTVIGDRGTESPLLSDHKALLFEKERNLLAFPVSVMEYPEGQSLKTGSYPVQSFQGAYVYDVDLSKGFSLRGRITHYSGQDILKSGNSLYGKNISRIVRIEDSLLTIGDGGIMSHTLSGIEKEAGVVFEDAGTVPGPVYWEE